jgi:hypothetical protein
LHCLALAQYPTNGNQKITLGEQTTADGLIYRGVLADTGIITPSSDTSAYIILDTVNHRFYNYNRATNVWSMAGVGSISSGLTGVLPVANGGTNTTTLTANKVMVGNGTSGVLTPTNLHWDNSSSRLGIGTASPVCSLHITNFVDISVSAGYQMTNFNVQSWGVANQTTSIKTAGTIWSEIRFVSTSDERVKKNIKPVTDSLDVINKLNIVSFDHIDFFKGSVKHGLIAQEVQKVYPDAVSVQREYIPSVFTLGTYAKTDNVTITSPIPHGFVVNDKIKLYINKDDNPDTRDFDYLTEVLEVISETEFVVKPWDDFETGKELLIYGKEVPDCLGIDKPLIGILAAGACKILSEKVTALEATVDAQAAEIASLKATVAAILEKISI